MKIRKAGTQDAEGILAINREGAPGVTLLGPAELASHLERATFLRVAESESALAGYVIVYGSDASYDGEEFLWFKRRPGSFLYVDQVAVAARARGAGVASALYADVERTARAMKIPALTCEVFLRPENPVSMRFHGRQGFREVGRLETRDGRYVSLMERPLDGAPASPSSGPPRRGGSSPRSDR